MQAVPPPRFRPVVFAARAAAACAATTTAPVAAGAGAGRYVAAGTSRSANRYGSRATVALSRRAP